LDTADVLERWRSIEAILQRVVSKQEVSAIQVANERHRPSYFGMVNPLVDHTRDRAARLRSSDVPEKGIPDAKNWDAVAIQLWLF